MKVFFVLFFFFPLSRRKPPWKREEERVPSHARQGRAVCRRRCQKHLVEEDVVESKVVWVSGSFFFSFLFFFSIPGFFFRFRVFFFGGG